MPSTVHNPLNDIGLNSVPVFKKNHLCKISVMWSRGHLDYKPKHFFFKILHVLLLLIGKYISALHTKSIFQDDEKWFSVFSKSL